MHMYTGVRSRGARFARSLLYLCAAYYCAYAIDDLYLHKLLYAHAHEQASARAQQKIILKIHPICRSNITSYIYCCCKKKKKKKSPFPPSPLYLPLLSPSTPLIINYSMYNSPRLLQDYVYISHIIIMTLFLLYYYHIIPLLILCKIVVTWAKLVVCRLEA